MFDDNSFEIYQYIWYSRNTIKEHNLFRASGGIWPYEASATYFWQGANSNSKEIDESNQVMGTTSRVVLFLLNKITRSVSDV